MKIRALFSAIIFICSGLLHAQIKLQVYPGYATAGYYITLDSGTDSDHSAKVKVEYKSNGLSNWTEALAPDYCFVKSPAQFRGALFLLSKGKTCYIKITYTDSIPTLFSKTIIDSFYLKTEPQIVNNANEKWVSPNGSGTAYTQANPGDLKTLVQSGTLGCGITVKLKAGVYHTGEMQLNFNQNCNAQNPLQFVPETPGSVVFDGGDTTHYTWTKVASDTFMYTATIKPELEFNQLCLLDTQRLYPYAFAFPDAVFTTYPCLSKLEYGLPGYYRLGNQVYIKTPDHKNPNQFKITFSKYFYFMAVNGNHKNNHIIFKNLKFKNYAKGRVDRDIFNNPSVSYPGFGISFSDANFITVTDCDFEFCNSVLSFNGACSNNLVSDCSFKDDMSAWSHGAFKQTRDQSIVNYGTYGRYLEYSAVMVNEGDSFFMQNCIKNSRFSGIIAGVIGEVSGVKGAIKETEILNNKVTGCYNGINTDGKSINTRIMGNVVGFGQVGLSFIGAEEGPNYVLRNIVHHIQGKKNHNDIFFMNCNNVSSDKIWGTGLKMNATARTSNPPAMHFYHNNFHGVDSLGFSWYLWNATWKKIYSANNIHTGSGISTLFLDGIKGDTNYAWNSTADLYFNSKGNIATLQPVNGQPNCETYSTAQQLSTGIATNTKSGIAIFKQNVVGNPLFVNENKLDFNLSVGSPALDFGTVISGINNDYMGPGPDIGAIESPLTQGIKPLPVQTVLLYPNPTGMGFYIPKYLMAESVEVFSFSGQRVSTLLDENQFVSLEKLPVGFYLVEIKSQGHTYFGKILLQR